MVSLSQMASVQRALTHWLHWSTFRFAGCSRRENVLSITRWPRRALLSIVLTNACTSYSLTNETSFCSQFRLGLWTQWLNIWSWPEASGPAFPHILGPFVFPSYVRLSKLFPPPSPFQENKSIPYVHLYPFLIILSRSPCSSIPHSSLSQIREMFYFNFNWDINEMGFSSQRDSDGLKGKGGTWRNIKITTKISEKTTGVKWNGARDGEGGSVPHWKLDEKFTL